MSTPPPIPGPSSGPSFIPLALPQDPQEPPLFHCCSRSIPPVSSFPDPCLLPHTPSVSPDPSSHSAFNAEVHFHISQFELQLESTNNCLESTTTHCLPPGRPVSMVSKSFGLNGVISATFRLPVGILRWAISMSSL